MKFTRGLFLGAALGMSAAMLVNNNMKGNNNNNANQNTTGITAATQNQTNDNIVNDII